MAKEIIIDFDENGNPMITAKGYEGPICEQETAELEKALGTVTARKLTKEHNIKVQQAQTHARKQQQNG